MKVIRCILILMVLTGLTIVMIGCGVSEDEHQKVVTELSETKAQLDAANSKIAQLEKSVKKLEKVGTPVAMDTGIKEKLAAAQEKVKSLTNENSNLKGMLEKLKQQLAQLQSKLKGLQGSSGSLGSDLLKKR